MGQRRDRRVLHDQEADLRPQGLAGGLINPGIDRVGGDIQTAKLAGIHSSCQFFISDDLALEVLEHRGHALTIRALLGVDRERTRDDEAGVARAALALVGLKRLVGPARRNRPHRQHIGRVQAFHVAGQQKGFLDRQERRKTAATIPPAPAISLKPWSTAFTASSIATGCRSLLTRTYIAASKLGSLAAL